MLARFRSASGLEAPDDCTGNAIQEFLDMANEGLWELTRERMGKWGRPEEDEDPEEALQAQFGTTQPLGAAFRIWKGALAGVVHLLGQFPALQEGPAGEGVPSPPPELAEALAADLDLLLGLVDTVKHLSYPSESDYGMLPIILEPRPAVVAGNTASSGGADGGSGGAAVGPEGPWWPIERALSVPLSKDEVTTSLGVAPALAKLFQVGAVYTDKEDWVRKMRASIQDNDEDEGQTAQADAFEKAVRALAAVVCYPVQEVIVGWEAGWNPIPLMWVGRSKRSGAVIGLLTFVVWT